MPQLLVRNVDAKTVARLKEQAKRNHRSLQGEAKAILDTSVKYTLEETQTALESWRKRFRGRKFSDSAKLIREDRER